MGSPATGPATSDLGTRSNVGLVVVIALLSSLIIGVAMVVMFFVLSI
jgi:hypothetical protein